MIVHGSDRNGSEPADVQPQLRAAGQLAPGVVMNRVHAQRLGLIVQSTTVMMDAVSMMGTGSNGAVVQMNVSRSLK